MMVLMLLCGILGGLLSAVATGLAGFGWLAMLMAYSAGGMLSVLAVLGGTVLLRPMLASRPRLISMQPSAR